MMTRRPTPVEIPQFERLAELQRSGKARRNDKPLRCDASVWLLNLAALIPTAIQVHAAQGLPSAYEPHQASEATTA